MDVMMENNPVINRVWNEWLVLDQELSSLSKEKRMKLYEGYQWIFKNLMLLNTLNCLRENWISCNII